MSPAKVMPDLGQTLLNLGQFQQVLDETGKLSEEKNSAEISTLRGNSFLALGKAKEAKDLFELALKDKPDFSDAFIGLAKYSLSARDIEAATDFAEQAVTRNPENADAWLFKGDLLRMQGKADPALAAYDQVVKLKPNRLYRLPQQGRSWKLARENSKPPRQISKRRAKWRPVV